MNTPPAPALLQQAITEIATIANQWITQGRAFTAFEVSLEVQNRLDPQHNQGLRHRFLRDYIHSSPPIAAALGTTYTTSSVDVGQEEGETLTAMLYHPVAFDPINYIPLTRHGYTAPAAPGAAATTPTPNGGTPSAGGSSLSI